MKITTSFGIYNLAMPADPSAQDKLKTSLDKELGLRLGKKVWEALRTKLDSMDLTAEFKGKPLRSRRSTAPSARWSA